MPALPPLILASSSPRRRELLTEAGYKFGIMPPLTADECSLAPDERPAEFVMRVARDKAADVAARVESGLVLACDTVAELDGRILGKPADEQHARAMLQALSGREHRVYSGVCLWPVPGGHPKTRFAKTTLRMDTLSPGQLDEYLATGEWQGKAGAFGYQDRLGWVHVIEGSESNVVGLPMELLEEMLRELPWGRPPACH
jgi:septum formation protein